MTRETEIAPIRFCKQIDSQGADLIAPAVSMLAEHAGNEQGPAGNIETGSPDGGKS